MRSPAGGGAAEDVAGPGSSCWLLATSGVGTRQEVAQGVAERGGEGLGARGDELDVHGVAREGEGRLGQGDGADRIGA